MDKARSGHQWDVKVSNNIEQYDTRVKEMEDIYRGVRISKQEDVPIYASARDVGNIAAGIVAGSHGIIWPIARLGFDTYQSLCSGYPSIEGLSSQTAQWYGWRIGHHKWSGSLWKLNYLNFFTF